MSTTSFLAARTGTRPVTPPAPTSIIVMACTHLHFDDWRELIEAAYPGRQIRQLPETAPELGFRNNPEESAIQLAACDGGQRTVQLAMVMHRGCPEFLAELTGPTRHTLPSLAAEAALRGERLAELKKKLGQRFRLNPYLFVPASGQTSATLTEIEIPVLKPEPAPDAPAPRQRRKSSRTSSN